MRGDDSSIGKAEATARVSRRPQDNFIPTRSKKFAFLQTPEGLSTRWFHHLLRLMFKAAVQILLQQSATESIRARES